MIAFPAGSTASPPIHTESLPGTGGRIGPGLEDFQVDEVPLYAPCGEGEHLYVRIEKRGMTTRDAVRLLSTSSGAPMSEIGAAGMKDKHAVTRQWVSMPARRAKPVTDWNLPAGLSVIETARHKNKLRTGHLAGNRFTIRVVGVTENALSHALTIVDALTRGGLPNYFGAQRFGRDADNVESALEWLDSEIAGRRAPPFRRKLFSSVLQSEVFNRYVTLRLKEGLSAPLAGEVVRLEGTGSHFIVEDPERELPRWVSRDIHPTGPMIGPKMKAARGQALELEELATQSLSLDASRRAALGRFADGARRDLLVWPSDLRVSAAPNAPDALELSFFLPSGSYATQLVRELTREPYVREGVRDEMPERGPEDAGNAGEE